MPRKLKKMKKPRMTLYDVPDAIFQADCKSRPCALKEIVNLCLFLTFRETTLYGKMIYMQQRDRLQTNHVALYMVQA